MLTEIAYMIYEEGVMVCRCYGTGSDITLPDRIDDLPVTALADHCFGQEPSFALRGVQKKIAAQRSDGTWGNLTGEEKGTKQPEAYCPKESDAICAQKLAELILPESLQRIGDYAFYGCRCLQRITLPDRAILPGRGIFTACNHIGLICLRRPGFADTQEDTAPLKSILSDIPYEVEVALEDAAGEVYCRLMFTEYYEDSVENTPARIISIKYEGTGYSYRQCLRRGTGADQIDLTRYDELFYAASVQEYPDTVMRLALDRILYPVGLSEQAQERYLAYLREQSAKCIAHVLSQDYEMILRKMDEISFFTGHEQILEEFIAAAARRNMPDAVILLMQIRRKTQPEQRRKITVKRAQIY